MGVPSDLLGTGLALVAMTVVLTSFGSGALWGASGEKPIGVLRYE